jgi:murein DD-endopeptidase MepM/ murein hydrolase activator NlpD
VNAGGLAFSKPILIPGAPLVRTRNQAEDYVVQAGDSLGGIASDFGVRVETIIWENNLSVKSYLKPGQIIKIPPVDGVMHVVKKGDTLQKIAGLYKAKPEDIASFNALQADGRDLKVGVKIMVPGGTAVATVAAAKKPTSVTKPSLVSRVAVPPPSVESAGATGFIWPSGARNITQYFGFSHHALDIAGPMHTPNYAAQDGIVEVANCPPPGEYRGPKLNHGYGCYVIINHGAGIKTLYGHNDLVLVSEGDQVERGQTVGLMGNTGNVRGRTGIHLHFEVRKNGTTVNPLGYVR